MAEEHAEQEPETVEAVLAGRASYDDLATDAEQAAVRVPSGTSGSPDDTTSTAT